MYGIRTRFERRFVAGHLDDRLFVGRQFTAAARIIVARQLVVATRRGYERQSDAMYAGYFCERR
jgi:hypothetical protein